MRNIFTCACVASALFSTSCATQTAHVPRAPQADLEQKARTEQEFTTFDPHYKEEKAERIAKARAFYAKVREREAAGQSTSCSHQILWELKALIVQSADFKLMDQRLADLEDSLAHPEREAEANTQDPQDGSWGRCFAEWYCKLDASTEEIGRDANRRRVPDLPPRFLDRVNSPEKLTDYLTSVSVSDIAHTGVDNLAEFNLSLSDLIRLILRDRPQGYPWDPRLKATLRHLIFDQFRNPKTGWWGERYVRDGHVVFVDDLSTTFHIVTYFHGNVPDLPRIVDTTLAVKDLDYPVGWLWKGQYWNHNNMDVVALFKAGWPQASAAQKQAMTVEIEKMLNWCLTESLKPDGSFEPVVADGSLEEGESYATSFLARIGFFDKKERFWTSREFPEADAVRGKILAYVLAHQKAGGSGGGYYESILEDCLNYIPPRDTAHTTTSTNDVAASVPRADLEHPVRIRREFVAFDSAYKDSQNARAERLNALGKKLRAQETAGQKTACANQILSETMWMLFSTADFKRIDQRLHDLEESLSHTDRQSLAEEQSPEDGSWGQCCTEWFFKVNASYDHFAKRSNKGEKPPYEYHFLDRVNSPELLTNYFLSVSVSDIPHTGVDHRRELNESLSNLMRLTLRNQPAGYAWHPQLRDALMDLILHRLRNPATGYWGERYVRDGGEQFVDDLSVTFHVISYLHGAVPDLPKVIDTTLALKNLEYPQGWLENAQYVNHHNMDVVTLFRFGWPQASDAQKNAMATEINKMLQWCLTESLQQDGSFKSSKADGADSLEEITAWGVAFLNRIGFFDRSKRFWTNQEFPEAEGIRQRIIAFILHHRASGGAGGGYYEDALDELGYIPPPEAPSPSSKQIVNRTSQRRWPPRPSTQLTRCRGSVKCWV